MITCCHKRENRYQGCHAKCELYLEQKEKELEEKRKIIKGRQLYNHLKGFEATSKKRMHRGNTMSVSSIRRREGKS